MDTVTCAPLWAHLPTHSKDFFFRGADVLLSFRDRLFLSHSQVLALESPHIAALISLQREQAAGGLTAAWLDTELPVVRVLPSVPLALPSGIQNATTEQFSAFLAHLYRREEGFEWGTLPGVLQLADYFGASSLLVQADAWLCDQCRQQDSRHCCLAFELAARHRLGGSMALLLPWAVQCMARGSRCSVIWFDGKQRCTRVQAAFEDLQLKGLVLDAYWWSRQAQQACNACTCRPADISASWDTQHEWAAPPPRTSRARGNAGITACCVAFQPGMYDRAVQHYAHLLAEAKWPRTLSPAPPLPTMRLE